MKNVAESAHPPQRVSADQKRDWWCEETRRTVKIGEVDLNGDIVEPRGEPLGVPFGKDGHLEDDVA